VPVGLCVLRAEAIKASLGPLFSQHVLLERRLSELEANDRDAATIFASDVVHATSKNRHRKSQVEKALADTEAEIELRERALTRARTCAARRVALPMSSDLAAYEGAVDRLAATGAGARWTRFWLRL
jgi:hypothetical protein